MATNPSTTTITSTSSNNNPGSSSKDEIDTTTYPGADANETTAIGNMLVRLNGVVDDFNLDVSRSYIDDKYYMATNAMSQYVYSTSKGLADAEAILLAVVRHVMNLYTRKIDPLEQADLTALDYKGKNPALITDELARRKVFYAQLKALTEPIIITVGQQIAKSGHHYLSQYKGPFKALFAACGVEDANVNYDIICHKAIHPLAPENYKQTLGDKSNFSTVRLRSLLAPAGFAWIFITRAVIGEMVHFSYGSNIKAYYGQPIDALNAVCTEVSNNPWDYSNSYIGGKRTVSQALAAIKAPSDITEDTMKVLAAIAGAWINIYADRPIDSAAFKKQSSMKMGVKASWESLFRAEKANQKQSIAAEFPIGDDGKPTRNKA